MAIVNGKSGSFTTPTNDSNVYCRVDWKETYDSETYQQTNKTHLRFDVYLCRKTNATPLLVENKKLSRILKCGNQTHNVTGTIERFPFTGDTTPQSVFYWDVDVAHDEDGSKTTQIGFYMNIVGPNNEALGSEYNCLKVPAQNPYPTITLTTISRTTKPTFSKRTVNVNGTDSITISLKPAVSTHKHKLKYNFGSWPNGQSAGISIGNGFSAQGNTTVTFTPPKNLWEKAADEDTICTFRCETYDSSGNYIGREDTYLYFADVVITPVQPANWPAGLDGVIVQEKTNLEIKVNRPKAEFPEGLGGPLMSVHVGGVVAPYEGDIKVEEQLFRTKTLATPGENEVYVDLVSSPNNILVFSDKITVEPYDFPTIYSVSASRPVDDDTTVIVVVRGKVSSLANKNAKTVIVKLKKDGKEIARGEATPTTHDFEVTVPFTGVSSDEAYDGTALLDDYFWGDEKNFSVGTPEVIMDFHVSGKGVAFGKVSLSEDLLEVDWDLQCNKTITAKAFKREGSGDRFHDILDTDIVRDYVIDEGETDDGVWRYRRWSSGFAECWGFEDVATSISTGQGQYSALYASNPIKLPNFPYYYTKFTETPSVYLSWVGGQVALLSCAYSASTESAGNTILYNPTAVSSVSGKIAIYACGACVESKE